MVENPYFIPGLIGAVLVFQLILFLLIVGISGKIKRLSRMLVQQEPPIGPDLAGKKEATADQKKWFEVFLNEDPARRELPKKEQFAAFRRWREDQGLNWKA
jgi:hypothetical protein